MLLLCSICRCKMNRVTWLLCQLLIYVIYLLTFSYLLKVFYFYNNSPIVGYKIVIFVRKTELGQRLLFLAFFSPFSRQWSPVTATVCIQLYSVLHIGLMDKILFIKLSEITFLVRFGKISYNPCILQVVLPASK